MIVILLALWWLAGFTGHLYLESRFNPYSLTWGGLTTALVIGLFGGPLWWVVALFTAEFWSRPVFRKGEKA